jgi:hypothetical protein
MAISVIESEEVLLVKMVCFGQILSRAVHNSRFAGSSSTMASITKSQSLKSSRFVVPWSRA